VVECFPYKEEVTGSIPVSPTIFVRRDRDGRSLEDNRPVDSLKKKSRVDKLRIEKAVRAILIAMGEDPNRDGLRKTPERIGRLYEEICYGLHEDPAKYLEVTFAEKHRELVLLKDVPFYSLCEHHLLPFMGQAHIAYLPKGRIVGISKLARVLDVFARRPQVQERLTSQIADLIMDKLKPLGVAVMIQATHTCMTMRGIQKPGSVMVTSAIRGHFRKNHAARDEVWAHLHHPVSF
jgi:GTP cyclohydrolase IA